MSEELYESDYPYDTKMKRLKRNGQKQENMPSDHDPCFDVAEFFRCGRHIHSTKPCKVDFKKQTNMQL